MSDSFFKRQVPPKLSEISVKKPFAFNKGQSIDSHYSLLSPRIDSITKSTPSHLKSTSILSSISSVKRILMDDRPSFNNHSAMPRSTLEKSSNNNKFLNYKLYTANLIAERLIKYLKKHFLIWKINANNFGIWHQNSCANKSLNLRVSVNLKKNIGFTRDVEENYGKIKKFGEIERKSEETGKKNWLETKSFGNKGKNELDFRKNYEGLEGKIKNTRRESKEMIKEINSKNSVGTNTEVFEYYGKNGKEIGKTSELRKSLFLNNEKLLDDMRNSIEISKKTIEKSKKSLLNSKNFEINDLGPMTLEELSTESKLRKNKSNFELKFQRNKFSSSSLTKDSTFINSNYKFDNKFSKNGKEINEANKVSVFIIFLGKIGKVLNYAIKKKFFETIKTCFTNSKKFGVIENKLQKLLKNRKTLGFDELMRYANAKIVKVKLKKIFSHFFQLEKFAFDKINFRINNSLLYEYRRPSNYLKENIENIKNSIQQIINSKRKIASIENNSNSVQIRSEKFGFIISKMHSEVRLKYFFEFFHILKSKYFALLENFAENDKNSRDQIEKKIMTRMLPYFNQFSLEKNGYRPEIDSKILQKFIKNIKKDVFFQKKQSFYYWKNTCQGNIYFDTQGLKYDKILIILSDLLKSEKKKTLFLLKKYWKNSKLLKSKQKSIERIFCGLLKLEKNIKIVRKKVFVRLKVNLNLQVINLKEKKGKILVFVQILKKNLRNVFRILKFKQKMILNIERKALRMIISRLRQKLRKEISHWTYSR